MPHPILAYPLSPEENKILPAKSGDTTAFDLLTLSDVAKILRCSKAHVCKAVAGQLHGVPPIPAIALGRRRLVRRGTLLQWIEARETGGDAMIPASLEIDAG